MQHTGLINFCGQDQAEEKENHQDRKSEYLVKNNARTETANSQAYKRKKKDQAGTKQQHEVRKQTK